MQYIMTKATPYTHCRKLYQALTHTCARKHCLLLQIWKASGHVAGFSDPMVDCRESKLRYRADQLFFSRVTLAETGEELGAVTVIESGTMQQEAEAAADKVLLLLLIVICYVSWMAHHNSCIHMLSNSMITRYESSVDSIVTALYILCHSSSSTLVLAVPFLLARAKPYGLYIPRYDSLLTRFLYALLYTTDNTDEAQSG
jgi:hypothetical protein